MTNNEDFVNELIQKLCAAINKAIVDSQEVRDVIQTFNQNNMIAIAIDYNLILDTKSLIEYINKQPGGVNLRASVAENKIPAAQGSSSPKAEETSVLVSSGEFPRKPLKDAQFIDGKRLSENEMMFENYFRARFNEAEWLKKTGIRIYDSKNRIVEL